VNITEDNVNSGNGASDTPPTALTPEPKEVTKVPEQQEVLATLSREDLQKVLALQEQEANLATTKRILMAETRAYVAEDNAHSLIRDRVLSDINHKYGVDIRGKAITADGNVVENTKEPSDRRKE